MNLIWVWSLEYIKNSHSWIIEDNPILKWAKDLHRHFCEGNKQITNKQHGKMFYVIGHQKNANSSQKIHFNPSTNIGEGVKKLEPSRTPVRNGSSAASLETVWQVFKSFNPVTTTQQFHTQLCAHEK